MALEQNLEERAAAAGGRALAGVALDPLPSAAPFGATASEDASNAAAAADGEHRAPAASGTAARGSSFYAAMRILPRAQRDAMYDVYAFCRAVDDIADDLALDRAEKLRQLDAWRAAIDRLDPAAMPAGHARLAHTARQYDLDRADFIAVIDGMTMDALADIQAPDEATLDLYCDRVASAVGRLSTPIFGMPRDAGIALAHHLGRALQLTNILRDVDEDAGLGRLYLPRELLLAAGIVGHEPAAVVRDPALAQVCDTLVERARQHYERAVAIMAGCDAASVRAPRIMAAVYRRVLEETARRGFLPPRTRVKVGRTRLIAIALMHLLFR
ncbi:presqualene diphosphate synthase HpnD [Chitinasiproducens palmae]|uniref:Farnesyl-diphosphate farnesyltransferase n=1 Tax=Chitinasiproducens palmae TaxID=1770053 RepID=A0A1H2PSE8_9BURK|nr:presqualene diphosphate synthase HpnD [Chitinasiproducens palmae]SDV49904.1 farnesyl-diphosphate farnesyltransferase [Chitinasiproducens palmae]